MTKPQDQITNLKDLLKIPEEKRNFNESRNRIQNLIEEKDSLTAQIESKDNDNEIMTKESPLEKILNTPGLMHLAENILNNLEYEDMEVYRNINQISQQILDNPIFWLKKFRQLSMKNQKDWIKAIQSVNNSNKEKAIVSYLQWNLKRDTKIDLPCFSNTAVQDDFRKKIYMAAMNGNIEIVKILAPLTANPNAPNNYGETPIHKASWNGHTEIVKILAPLTDNPNAPDKDGFSPIICAASLGHTKIVKILAPLTDNPNAPKNDGETPILMAAKRGHIEIVKFLAPLTDNPNVPNIYGETPISVAKNAKIRRILQSIIITRGYGNHS